MFNSDDSTLPNVLIMIADFLLWPHDWTADSDDGYLRENLRTWGGNLVLFDLDKGTDAEIHIVKISLIIFGQVTVCACLFMFKASHKLGLPQSLLNSYFLVCFLHFYVCHFHKQQVSYLLRSFNKGSSVYVWLSAFDILMIYQTNVQNTYNSSFDQDFVSLTNITNLQGQQYQ